MNKQRTMNMFAETSEDLPIISGMARTQAAEMPQPEPTSKELYETAKQELIDLGLTIKQSSWFGWNMVVVSSCEVFDQGTGHGPCEFVAVLRHGKWDINRYYERG